MIRTGAQSLRRQFVHAMAANSTSVHDQSQAISRDCIRKILFFDVFNRLYLYRKSKQSLGHSLKGRCAWLSPNCSASVKERIVSASRSLQST